MPGIYNEIFDVDVKEETVKLKMSLIFTSVLTYLAGKNYYEMFGIKPFEKNPLKSLSDIDKNRIKAEFREISRYMHPDRFRVQLGLTDPVNDKIEIEAVAEIYKRVSMAYNTLSDLDRKKAYDEQQFIEEVAKQQSKHKDASSHFNPFNTTAGSHPFTQSQSHDYPPYNSKHFNPNDHFPGYSYTDPNIRSDRTTSSAGFSSGAAPQFKSSSAAYGGYAQGNNSQSSSKRPNDFSSFGKESYTPPKPANTPEYDKWHNFTRSITTPFGIEKFITDNKDQLHSSFKKNLVALAGDSIFGKYNPLRVAIEAGASLHVKFLLLEGAKFDNAVYQLGSNKRFACTGQDKDMLISEFKEILKTITFSTAELIKLLSGDQGVVEHCDINWIIKLLKTSAECDRGKLIEIIKKISGEDTVKIYDGAIAECNVPAISIILEAMPGLKDPSIHQVKELVHKMHKWINTRDNHIAYENIRALLHFFIKDVFNILNTRELKWDNLIDEIIKRNDLPFIQALLNSGILLNEDTLNKIKRYRPDHSDINFEIMNYLVGLPKHFLNYQALLVKVMKLLSSSQLPGVSVNCSAISIKIQLHFIQNKFSVTDILKADCELIIQQILMTTLNYLIKECGRAFFQSTPTPEVILNVNKATCLLNQAKLLCYVYEFEQVEPLPTIQSGAELILQKRIASGVGKNGDYVICRNKDQRSHLIVSLQNGVFRTLPLTTSSIPMICEFQFVIYVIPTIEELFKLRSDTGMTILHINATGQPLNESNLALSLLLQFPELIKPIINLADSNDNTVLRLAATHYQNGAICRQLVALGAKVDEYVAALDQDYIPDLVKIAGKYDQQQRQLAEQEALNKLRDVAAQQAEGLFKLRDAKLTAFIDGYRALPFITSKRTGRLNIAILDKKDIPEDELKLANNSTIICAIVVKNFALVAKLIAEHPLQLSADAFTVGLLTDHKDIIKLLVNVFPVNRYPKNIEETLAICTSETKQLVSFDIDKAFELQQSGSEETGCSEVLKAACQVTPQLKPVGENDNPVAMEHEPTLQGPRS